MADEEERPKGEQDWEAELTKGAVTTGRIVIERRILSDGTDAWRCTFAQGEDGDLMPLVEIFGLLELAKLEAVDQWDDEEDD